MIYFLKALVHFILFVPQAAEHCSYFQPSDPSVCRETLMVGNDPNIMSLGAAACWKDFCCHYLFNMTKHIYLSLVNMLYIRAFMGISEREKTKVAKEKSCHRYQLNPTSATVSLSVTLSAWKETWKTAERTLYSVSSLCNCHFHAFWYLNYQCSLIMGFSPGIPTV